jgi:adenine-specific DNA-methyltransferase
MPNPVQLSFEEPTMEPDVLDAEERDAYGEVFTRRWVADLILDLVGYLPEHDLADMVLVEPACGGGAFLEPIVDRLIESAVRHGHALDTLGDSLRAIDLKAANVELSRKSSMSALVTAGVPPGRAEQIARAWINQGDFLLDELDDEAASGADFVVGNPPYIRIEDLPPDLVQRYRAACPTMQGRADIYVGFFERGLQLLRPQGRLGFICADRWMHNQYGAGLRRLISGSFAVESVITMHDVDAFEQDVSAYPAVTVLRSDRQGRVSVAEATDRLGASSAPGLVAWLKGSTPQPRTARHFNGSRLPAWFDGGDPWPTGSPKHLELLRQLEQHFPPLEDSTTGTRVGIGVATGCDDVFITTDPDLVEEDRLLPLLLADDLRSGTAEWQGRFLVNPWDDDGLVDLSRHPRLRAYFEAHVQRLGGRHVARRRPDQWYRTIDRVQLRLLDRPRLVLPDMKSTSHPVLDAGPHYPHHNLYHVTSNSWDLEVLGGLLLSNLANLFVGAYCVKMRGGCYRFQAQYLRRIRVPVIESIRPFEQNALRRAFASRDVPAATAVACKLFGIERSALAP